MSLLLMALTVTASSKQARWWKNTQIFKKRGSDCHHDESPRALKGAYTLTALWPLKQKMGHKETIASRRTKNVVFFSFSSFCLHMD